MTVNPYHRYVVLAVETIPEVKVKRLREKGFPLAQQRGWYTLGRLLSRPAGFLFTAHWFGFEWFNFQTTDEAAGGQWCALAKMLQELDVHTIAFRPIEEATKSGTIAEWYALTFGADVVYYETDGELEEQLADIAATVEAFCSVILDDEEDKNNENNEH